MRVRAATVARKNTIPPLLSVPLRLTIVLILASSSPRRRQLLEQIGLAFTVDSAGLDEQLQPNESPAKYVQRLALEKAQAVWERHRSADDSADPLIVLGADTAVVLD